MKRIQLLILIILTGLIFGSCIQTEQPDIPNRINFLFNVNNVGSTITADQDSLTVNEFKLLTDKFNLLVPDGAKLQSKADALVMAYRTEKNGDDELVLAVSLGYQDFKSFDGVKLFVAPPANEDNVRDNDFFGDDKNYSLVIKGEYNEKDFTYRSSTSFEEKLEYSIVELTDDNPHITLRVLLDIEDVMIDPNSGDILNPNNQENKAVIDSLTQTSLNVEAFATDEVLFEEDF